MAWRPGALLGVVLLAGCAASATPPGADYLIVFPLQSTALDSNAARVAGFAAAAARAAPDAPVTVEGYLDPAGSPQANQILSRLRGQAVADALVQAGVARARVRLRPRGVIGGDPGIESRRVRIVIGP